MGRPALTQPSRYSRPLLHNGASLALSRQREKTWTRQVPASIRRYAVIGAGIHGLSTAWHLAMELEAKRHGLRQGHRCAGQDRPGRRRQRHRLRLRAQSLHDRAAACDPAPLGRCVDLRPRRLWLPAGGLRLRRRSQPAQGLREAARQPEPRRLSTPTCTRAPTPSASSRHLARLQHRRHRRRAAREDQRLCRHAPGHRRPRPEMRRPRRAHPLRRRGQGLRPAQRPRGEAQHQQGRHRLRRRRARPRRLDARSTGRCSASR